MSLQIYTFKKNFAVQKAERFFKERRVQVQAVDMKKHKPGLRELQLFARAVGGAKNLVDRENVNALSHPVAHTDQEAVILDYLAGKCDKIPSFDAKKLINDIELVRNRIRG